MRKIEEMRNPDSCWNKAKDEEFVFTLLERDLAAADTIRFWVSRRIQLKKNTFTDPQIQDALELADKIELLHLASRQQGERKVMR